MEDAPGSPEFPFEEPTYKTKYTLVVLVIMSIIYFFIIVLACIR